MKSRLVVIALALFLSACNEKSSQPNYQPPIYDWTFSFSPGLTGNCAAFKFPQTDGAHYCVKPAQATPGQTIAMTFTITGDTMPVQADDTPPATLRLFVWRAGDNISGQGVFQQYRIWGDQVTNLTPGQHTVSVPLTPDHWTDVFGQQVSAAALASTLSSAYGIGYTFGGQSFAGHGVRSRSGQATFQLDSFVIQ